MSLATYVKYVCKDLGTKWLIWMLISLFSKYWEISQTSVPPLSLEEGQVLIGGPTVSFWMQILVPLLPRKRKQKTSNLPTVIAFVEKELDFFLQTFSLSRFIANLSQFYMWTQQAVFRID